MNRMLVVVFDNEDKAYEGKNALLKLNDEGSISVYAHAMLAKHADGTVTVNKQDDFGPCGTLAGAELGTLIGLLGGPTGLAVGAVVGLLAGSAVDLNKIRIGDDFVDDVTKQYDGRRSHQAVPLGWVLIVVSLIQSIVGQFQARLSPLTVGRHSYSRR